jgi:phage tail sheath gpL-like
MPLSQSSLAAAVGAGALNVKFQAEALNVPRKILIIATYDASKTGIADNVPALSGGPADSGDKYGFGSMAHRLDFASDEGAQGVETWICPQAEAGGAVASTGDVDFIGSAATAAGTLYMYVSGYPCFVTVDSGDTGVEIVAKLVAKLTELKELPLDGAVGTPTTTLDLTAKSKGPWGDDIVVSFNEGFQESFPAGVVAVVTAMSGGAGIPDIQDALDGLGTGDDQNEEQFTDGVHGYGIDTSTLNKLSVWNGVGNDFLGNYSKTVARPMRFLNGDTDPGSSALTALLALGNGRKTDRTNGIVPVPGSSGNPSEIAAKAIGIMARINNNRAAEHYLGQILPNVFPGAVADRWSSDYDDRDTAVKAGISPTVVAGGAVLLQNVLTYYHPDSVAVDSNGYRSQRNISILQNILENIRANFRTDKWQGISIVADVAAVTNSTDRQKARDVEAVIDDLVALATSFESRAWIFSAAFTIDRLKAGGLVTIRAGGTGFDIILPVLLSGEGSIYDTTVEFDTSLSVIL